MVEWERAASGGDLEIIWDRAIVGRWALHMTRFFLETQRFLEMHSLADKTIRHSIFGGVK
jgi:hypothetical protein